METERGEQVELESAAIDIVDCDRAGENQHLVGSPAQRDICFVDKSEADKKYRKIVGVLKKQSLSKAINEEVVNVKKKTLEFFGQQKPDEVDSCPPISGEISVETMKFAIKCLHKTQNPVHSFMNTLQVKAGNKEELLRQLEAIETVKRVVREGIEEEFITRDAFRLYTADHEHEKTDLEWWYCCDGDPEDRDAKGTLIDYFHGIARAQKLTANPISILFPIFGIVLMLIHYKASQEFKEKLEFDV